MQKSKLIQLFRSLTKKEVEGFGKFVIGQGYRQNSHLFNFYTYLKNHYPHLEGEVIDKELVYKKIMPKDKAYSDHQIRNLMSKLNTCLEDYLLLLALQESEPERELLMLKLLKKRRQDEMFFKRVEWLKKRWTKNPIAGLERYLYEYELQKIHNNHMNISPSKERIVLNIDLQDKLDQYYFAAKLEHAIVTQQDISLVINNDVEKHKGILFDEIYEQCQKNKIFEENLHVQIYYALLQSYRTKDSSNYAMLKSIYLNNFALFNDIEQRDIHVLLSNICYLNYQKDNSYITELFEIQKLGVEQKLLIAKNVLSKDNFRICISVACSAEEFEWTESFIRDYQQYLEKGKRKDIVLCGEGMFCFFKKDFKKSLEKYAQAVFPDALYALQGKLVQLKCYYELETYEEPFFSFVNSYRVYLYRSKRLSEATKNRYTNFINIIEKLYVLKQHFIVDKSEKIEKLLDSSTELINRGWLKEKLAELQEQHLKKG